MNVPPQSLDAVRFQPERELIERLTARFGFDLLRGVAHVLCADGVLGTTMPRPKLPTRSR